MTIEQPKFETPENELENKSNPTNVIEGPWPGSGLEAKAVPELEPMEQPPEQPADNPVEEVVPVLPESESEREEKLEAARQKLNELPDEETKPESALEPPDPQATEEDQKDRLRFSESYTKYEQQVCPKCKGKGLRWLLFKCPLCKGLGKISTPGPTITKYGYSEVNKKGNITKKITSETKG